MADVTASYGTPVFWAFSYWPFMSELLYLHQTFTDCVSNQ